MKADLRAVAYPLAAVHQREQGRLDAMQAELAAAAQRVAASGAARDELHACHAQAAHASKPRIAASIDPTSAQARLRYLADLHRGLVRCRAAHGALEQAEARVRDAVQRQHVKLETLERHRAAFLARAAAEQERKRSAETDREWLAGSQWRRVFGSEPRPLRDAAFPESKAPMRGHVTARSGP